MPISRNLNPSWFLFFPWFLPFLLISSSSHPPSLSFLMSHPSSLFTLRTECLTLSYSCSGFSSAALALSPVLLYLPFIMLPEEFSKPQIVSCPYQWSPDKSQSLSKLWKFRVRVWLHTQGFGSKPELRPASLAMFPRRQRETPPAPHYCSRPRVASALPQACFVST
jgi:hypothetical protein